MPLSKIQTRECCRAVGAGETLPGLGDDMEGGMTVEVLLFSSDQLYDVCIDHVHAQGQAQAQVLDDRDDGLIG
jgi:hypothetical protein